MCMDSGDFKLAEVHKQSEPIKSMTAQSSTPTFTLPGLAGKVCSFLFRVLNVSSPTLYRSPNTQDLKQTH